MRGFWADARGNIAVLFAMGFTISAMVGAVAVDAAAFYFERRVIQNGVDLAALAAAPDPTQALARAQQSLVEAGLLAPGSTEGLSVIVGHYNPDPAIDASARFVAGQAPANAVRVRLARAGTQHFAAGWTGAPTIGASALASVTPQVTFSIGSRLASLNGGIANAVLNGLLGTNVALTAMDYNGLAAAKVDVFDFLDALASELGITAGTYDEVLDVSVDHGVLAGALASELTGTARSAALAVAGSAGPNGSVALRKLFDLGDYGELNLGSAGAHGLFADISALELLTASAVSSDGNRQLALALTAGAPGLVGLAVDMAVGEPPQGGRWFAIGGSGEVVRTAQLRLRLIATVMGSGALAGAPIRLPIYLEMAHAEAVVGAASCPVNGRASGSATILARPGVLRAMVGDVDMASFGNFGATPAVGLAQLVEVKVLGVPVLRVLAKSLVEIAQTTPVALAFSSDDIAAGTVKTARTTTIVSSLANSLLDNLELQTPILGLGLNAASLTSLLRLILAPVTPTLSLTIARLLEALGLSVGEADVQVYAVHCGNAVLVG